MMMHVSALFPPALKQTFSRPASNPTSTPAPHTLPLSPLTADTFKPSNKGQRDGITAVISNESLSVLLPQHDGYIRNMITTRLANAKKVLDTKFEAGLLLNEEAEIVAEGVFQEILKLVDPSNPKRGYNVLSSLGMLDQILDIVPDKAVKLKRGLRAHLGNYAVSNTEKLLLDESAHNSGFVQNYHIQALLDEITRAVGQPTEALRAKERLLGLKGLQDIPTGFGYYSFSKATKAIQRSSDLKQTPFEGLAVGVDLISLGNNALYSKAEAREIALLPYLKPFIRRMESQFERVLTTRFPGSFELIHDFTPLYEN